MREFKWGSDRNFQDVLGQEIIYPMRAAHITPLLEMILLFAEHYYWVPSDQGLS